MTIDERIEKLTERHEALTQTVEIVAGMQHENERKIGLLTTLMAQTHEDIAALARIAEAHEHRIDRLEDQP
jgi:hypothetical protein